MVRAKIIPNCPITLDDIKNSNTIFGPTVSSLKEKMLRWKPKPVVSSYVKILKESLQLYKTVSVAADILFVNGMAFLVIISRNLKFTILQYIGKMTTDNIYNSLEKINYA